MKKLITVVTILLIGGLCWFAFFIGQCSERERIEYELTHAEVEIDGDNVTIEMESVDMKYYEVSDPMKYNNEYLPK